MNIASVSVLSEKCSIMLLQEKKEKTLDCIYQHLILFAGLLNKRNYR
jgi:hypothetical protein